MSKLTCPLCGREMTAIETHAGRGELYCGHCDLTIGGNEAKTPDELEALLRQRTCHTVSMDCFGNPPYNQSGLNGNSPACGCSECGAPWSTMGVFRGNQLRHNFKACPICGRRVVGA